MVKSKLGAQYSHLQAWKGGGGIEHEISASILLTCVLIYHYSFCPQKLVTLVLNHDGLWLCGGLHQIIDCYCQLKAFWKLPAKPHRCSLLVCLALQQVPEILHMKVMSVSTGWLKPSITLFLGVARPIYNYIYLHVYNFCATSAGAMCVLSALTTATGSVRHGCVGGGGNDMLVIWGRGSASVLLTFSF